MIYHNVDELLIDDYKWRRMALKIAQCEIVADEIVHRFYESYIRLKELKPSKTIHDGFINKALKNLLEIEHRNYKKKFQTYDYWQFDYFAIDDREEYDKEYDNETQTRIDFLMNELDGIEWFHRTIFKYVVMQSIPMRQLERDTGIHFNIIQKSVKLTKEYLKNKIQDGKETN